MAGWEEQGFTPDLGTASVPSNSPAPRGSHVLGFPVTPTQGMLNPHHRPLPIFWPHSSLTTQALSPAHSGFLITAAPKGEKGGGLPQQWPTCPGQE